MSGIQNSAVELAIVEQTSPTSGVPATPTFIPVRRTTADINTTRDLAKSEEARTDRQAGQNEVISSSVDSSLSSELAISDPAFLLLLESLFQNKFAADLAVSASTIGVDNGTAAFSDTAGSFANLEVGHFFKPSGFSNTENNIVYQVVTKTDNDNITVSPAPPVTEVAGATVTLKGQNLRNGANQVAYTMQKRIPYTGGTEYQTYEGVQHSSMSISIAPGALLTIDHTAVGLTELPGTSAIAGQTDAAQDTSRILGPVTGVTQYWIDGAPAAADTLNVTESNITIDQGATGVNVVGKEGAACLDFANQITVTGSFNTITKVAADTERSKYTNNTPFAYAMQLQNAAGAILILERPQCIYTEFTQPPSNTGLLTNTGTIDAENDSTLNYTIQATYIAP